MDDLISFSPQQPHDFALDLAGYDLKNLKATVETPSGKTEPAEIVETTKETYTIRFVTKEGGIYKVKVVSIKFKVSILLLLLLTSVLHYRESLY